MGGKGGKRRVIKTYDNIQLFSNLSKPTHPHLSFLGFVFSKGEISYNQYIGSNLFLIIFLANGKHTISLNSPGHISWGFKEMDASSCTEIYNLRDGSFTGV